MIRDVWKVHLVQGNWSQQKLIILMEALFAQWHVGDVLFVWLDWRSLLNNFWVSIKRVCLGLGATGLWNGRCISKCRWSGAVLVLHSCSSAHGFLEIQWLKKCCQEGKRDFGGRNSQPHLTGLTLVARDGGLPPKLRWNGQLRWNVFIKWFTIT